MADANKLKPFILKFEGGFVNDPDDKGGATNKGVTLTTYRKFFGENKTIEDLKRITDDEWLYIFKIGYWDVMKADLIKSQSVANQLVDFAYNSGTKTAAKKIQGIIGTTTDGIVGNKTIEAINSKDPKKLFEDLKKSRLNYIIKIVTNNPSQKKYLNGWVNRINSMKYGEF